jgi:hypothetical protein
MRSEVRGRCPNRQADVTTEWRVQLDSTAVEWMLSRQLADPLIADLVIHDG